MVDGAPLFTEQTRTTSEAHCRNAAPRSSKLHIAAKHLPQLIKKAANISPDGMATRMKHSGMFNKWSKAASPPHTDGSVVFARFRQCDLNLIRAPWAHPSPHPKRNLDRFSRFLHGSRR